MSLDAHVRAMIAHHFSADTGTPYWLRWQAERGLNVPAQVQGMADLLRLFPPFPKDDLKNGTLADWTPKAYAHRVPHVFETGGTTGRPTTRLSWDDHRIDYDAFSERLPEASFPKGTPWLILGPTGPRRLRLAMEHLANLRGGPAFFVDLDPRWVKQQLRAGQSPNDYLAHVVDQAATVLRHREPVCLFTTPRLLEALAQRVELRWSPLKGVLLGGTSMSPELLRFLSHEVAPTQTLVPVYGNTLMGLAASEPLGGRYGFEAVYHAPEPRAVLRVVDDAGAVVPYDTRGRVELTTLTPEFFLPRLLERDEAIRRPPGAGFSTDGVGDVRPLHSASQTLVEGVY